MDNIQSWQRNRGKNFVFFLPYLVSWRRHSNCFSSFTEKKKKKMRLERLKKALATPSFPAVLTNFCEADGWLAKTLRTASSLNQLTLPSAMKSIIKLTLP